MAYNDIVGESWGNPHPYMSSMWDVFVPNPRGERDLEKNIAAAGYMGANVSGVQDQRSPFGRLLQGIGLIGEPDKRPLTYYEQYLYEQGKHQRSEIDYQTEKQRIDKLQDVLSTVNEELKKGEKPSEMEDLLQYLPQSMRPGFERQAEQAQSDLEYQGVNRQLGLDYKQKLIDYYDWQMSKEKADVSQRQYDLHLGKLYDMPMVKHWSKVYDALLTTAFGQEGMERDNTLALAKEAHKLLQQAIKSSGGDMSEIYQIAGDPPDEMLFKGYGNARDPNTDERVGPKDAAGVDKFFDMYNYPPALPTQTPMKQGPEPTPTISPYQGMGGGY